jgi:hypothetical protein
MEYFILFLLCYFPFYTLSQLVVFQGLSNIYLVEILKYSKDFIILLAFIISVFGSKKTLLEQTWKLQNLDKLVLFFMGLTVFYALIPLGESSFVTRVLYAKNTLFIGFVYYIGRNLRLTKQQSKLIENIFIILILLAFMVSGLEFLFGTHLHQIVEYGKFNLIFKDIEPSGNYGLTWTFERQGGRPRYGAYFADPLEYAATLLLFLSFCLFRFYESKLAREKNWYAVLLVLITFSFLLASSRSSLVAGGVIVFATLILNKNFFLLKIVFYISIATVLYTVFFADKELQYFIIDSINFADSSSIGHVIEWITSINSIVESPLGIGLAMSGNAAGVEENLQIGGENQFLIYGVQMGIIGLITYFLMIVKSIYDSAKVYRQSSIEMVRSNAFVAGLTKLGFIIPLLTANAELYLFVSLYSWFLVGNTQNFLLKKEAV